MVKMKKNKEVTIGFRVDLKDSVRLQSALKKLSKAAGYEVKPAQFIRYTVMKKVDKILTK